jgi:hypothetical protein
MTRRLSLGAAGALVCAALALWVSFGAIAFLDTVNRAPYVGLLPSPLWLVVLFLVAVAVGVVMRPTPEAVAPLWLSAVVLLPWLPIRLPLAAFIWTGHVVIWVWAAIGACLIVPRLGVLTRAFGGVAEGRPTREALLAGILSLAAYSLGAWAVAPQHPTGDEPHYLVITQSLIEDHDIKIENNHRQRDYRSYSSVGLKPDFLRRGVNGQIYSIHAPGLPLLIAPAFAALGYRGVVAALVVISAIGGALAWLAAWLVTRDRGASWFGWAAVSLSVPYFVLSGSVFPDGPGAVLLLVGVLPLLDERARQPRWLFLAGAALATLPWLHTRFSVLAACAAVPIIVRLLAGSGRVSRIAAFLALPSVSAAAWLMFFQSVYGTANPSAPYGGHTDIAIANIVRGVPGLLVDQQFGLLATAPVYVCCFIGVLTMLKRGPRRFTFELLFTITPYCFLLTFFYMWWAGTSTAARFLAPVVLLLAIPAAVWVAAATGRLARAFSACTLLASLLMTLTVTLVDRGAFVFSFRDGVSRLVLWLSPVVNLTKAVPSLFQNPPDTVAVQASIWALSIAGAVVFCRLSGSRRGSAVRLGLALQVAAMVAVSLVWRTNHVDAATPASGGTAVLSAYRSDSGQLAIAYRPFRRVPLADLPGDIVLARTLSSNPRREWSAMSHLPPAVYEVAGTVVGTPAGHIRVLTDRRTSPLAVWDAAQLENTWKRTLLIPVAVAGLEVDLDGDAQRHVRDLTVRAVSVVPRADRLAEGEEAGHGARYGSAAVYALTGTVWVEPGGMWVGGASGAGLAVRPDEPGAIHLFLRNGPMTNDVTLASGSWRQEMRLQAGEERVVDVPADRSRLATSLQVMSAQGFRPSEVNPKTDDDRFLGVWIATQ